MSDTVYMTPNPPMPNVPLRFDAAVCNGCNTCVEICRTDVLMPNPERHAPPVVLYPDECWYCGCCVEDCPQPGAIEMVHPLHASAVIGWKRKDSGEQFRLGMKDPPAPNRRPPAG